jgi:nucleoside-diphosphate-sugar epimerase
MNWNRKKVLVTGGASFIGSHLVDALVERGAEVRVVDNLSSGQIENIAQHLKNDRIEFHQDDLKDLHVARKRIHGVQVLFHLAADHGGRGYVDLHPVDCATNLALDGVIFLAAHEGGVEKLVYASSGCVYPNHLQTDPNQALYLSEDLVRPPYDADNTYGWAKLMGEMTLKAYWDQHGLKSASCRYFTVYGPRGKENHAVMAMIARAFIKQNPFLVWGTGEQVRNWTYVGDIVQGTLLAAERIDDATAVNLGTMERIKVRDAVKEVLRYTGHKASMQFHPEMPTGPYNRVADHSLAKNLLGWTPKVSFWDGLHETIDWYYTHRKGQPIRESLNQKLTER